MTGTLYVVATPIGNLGDITVRALERLGSVDLIACEDSRVTRRLLQRYNITTPTTSYHQHSDIHKIAQLVAQLKSGTNVALVTDAGTPGVQDPAGRLVQAVRAEHIAIVPIPGPSAVTALLSVAGVSADEFYFIGFPPKKKGRETLFKRLATVPAPLVFYESPMRVERLLRDIVTHLGDRSVLVGRELTKKFEETKSGLATEVMAELASKKPKGEFVLIVLN